MERTCKKCGETKPIEEFTKSPFCIYGYSYSCSDCKRIYDKDRRPAPKPKYKPTEKICAKCKNEFPATEQYFFTKVCKYKLDDGTVKCCKSLRHVCKKCHSKIITLKNRKKRCIELNCTLEKYEDAYRKVIVYKKLKFKELAGATKDERITALVRYKTTGKLFMTEDEYSEYLFKKRTEISFKRRKYDYGDVERVGARASSLMAVLHATNARMAQTLGLSVKDVPVGLLEAKRQLVMLKRELGLTHSTKSVKTKN